MTKLESITKITSGLIGTYKKRAWEFVYQYLLTHPCQNCGEADPKVLDFHHVGEKDREIGRMIV
ncbi:MAG TPA: hypothetical protein VJM08_13745, partial [Anaerolineales bacterium]|nr:hypothetical protein [Anaerolineales bacterium]